VARFLRSLAAVAALLLLAAAPLRADSVPPIRPEQVPATPVPRKISHAPEGATAECKDGTFTKNPDDAQTCEGHGGVAKHLDRSGK
jgi:hypothetical protein